MVDEDGGLRSAVRIGVDLMETSRIAKIAAHPLGRRLVFSERELAHSDSLGPERRLEYLAGRFCAKEATAKALGAGLGQGLVWREIEVLGDAHGAPRVSLSGGAAAIAVRRELSWIDLSLSHQAGMVICVALARQGPARSDAAGRGGSTRKTDEWT